TPVGRAGGHRRPRLPRPRAPPRPGHAPGRGQWGVPGPAGGRGLGEGPAGDGHVRLRRGEREVGERSVADDPTTPPAPRLRTETERRRQLASAKRRATTLLAAVSGVFVVVTIWGGDATWADHAQATAAASLVGGLAD